MRKDALQRDLPAPNEACARHYCLHQGVEAPDLATIKDFFSLLYRTILVRALPFSTDELALEF